MKRVVVLTPPDARSGFALAGVEQRTLRPEQLVNELSALRDDHDVGLLVVDERLAGGTARSAVRELEREWHGLLVWLPAPEAGARPDEDYVARLIRRAIGYQVRLGP